MAVDIRQTVCYTGFMKTLKFGRDNAKLQHLLPFLPGYLAYLGNHNPPKLYTISKLSGHHCPFAKECLSKAIMSKGKLHVEDGPHTKFRCFSASQEALYPALYQARKHNSDLIRGKSQDYIRKLIDRSLPDDCNVLRIHIGGDFSSQPEFDAWIDIAKERSTTLFYAYTKSLPFWIARAHRVPNNLVLTASYGGHKDALITKHNLRYAKVVFSEDEAAKLKLEIDHDDTHAANPAFRESFALLIHGTQPVGSEAGKAWNAIKKTKGGYSRN